MLAMIMALFLTIPVYPHTAENVRLLANTGWLENPVSDRNNQDQMDKLIMTMAVVLNRMMSDDKSWHLKGEKTVYDVVFAPGQYARSTRNKVLTLEAPEWVYELAEDILNYGTNVPSYIVYQSMQSGLGTVWKQIGTEYFATAGGHKNEGAEFHATVNCSISGDIRSIADIFRSSAYRRYITAVTDKLRGSGNSCSVFSVVENFMLGGRSLH